MERKYIGNIEIKRLAPPDEYVMPRREIYIERIEGRTYAVFRP